MNDRNDREPGGRNENTSDIREQLTSGPEAAGQARSAVRRALESWGMSELTGDAELLASELAANASEHAGAGPVSLTLHRHAEPGRRPGITCEIRDTSPVIPQPRHTSPGDERGRGLAIVSALANDSGVRAEQDGKTSWFTLALLDRVRSNARQIDREAGE